MTGVGQAFVMSVWYVEGAPPDKVAEETMPLEKHGVTGVLTDLVGKHSVVVLGKTTLEDFWKMAFDKFGIPSSLLGDAR